MENIETVINLLNADEYLQELIEDIVDDNYQYTDQPLYDENNKFIYYNQISQFLNNADYLKKLSSSDINAILNLVIECIVYKIEAKSQAYHKAYEDAYNDEYKDMYGSRENAFSHQFEKYLYDFFYQKNIADLYSEHQEKNNVK